MAPPCFSQSILWTDIPVSYTHLDVYKRQDQIKLREVLLNLLKNARESQADEIVLSASSGCDTSGIQISIRDNGCGIEQDQLDQIFQAFHTTKQEGTGLGLSLSKRIIEAHHGTLTVTSAPGEGSTFTVFLPL